MHELILFCGDPFVLQKNKIIVEKRRRERINSCLDEMKSLVLRSLHKDEREYSKMEKADILEMTVNYLQRLQTSSTGYTQGKIKNNNYMDIK